MAVKLRQKVIEIGNSSFDPYAVATTPAYHRQNTKPHKTEKLGDAKPYDFSHNCLTCDRWTSCRDSRKAANYRCSRFKEAVIEPTDLDTLFKNPEADDPNVIEEDIFKNVGKDEDSILAMIESVIDSQIPVPPDLRINDAEIPKAKNFFQWTTDTRFAAVVGGNPPFPRQVEIGTKLFGDWCPRCSDAEWFDDMRVDTPLSEIQEHVQFLDHGVCPKCKVGRAELYINEELPNYYGIVGLAGQRAAKTTSMVLWETYDLHRTLKLPSPQSVYGILPTTPIMSTFAATTFAQAVDNIWTPYKETINTTPWFKNYHRFLTKRGEELGEELFTLGEHSIRYRHRNLFISPSGPNKRTMRGRTRRSAAVDEIGWFKLAKKTGKVGDELELMDAKGVFDALDNSLFTLKNAHKSRIEEGYNDIPKPCMYIVSSPSQYNDFIMSAFRLYQHSPERLAFKYASWDFNPLIKKSAFKEAYKLRPVETARDFECNPPIGEGLFISDHQSLEKAFRYGPNKISVNTSKGKTKSGSAVTNSNVRITSNSFPVYGTLMCVDIGLVNNSLTFSIIGPADDFDTDTMPEDRGTLQNPVKVFACGEIIPKAGTRINLTSVYTEVFIPLLEPFNVCYFVSDRWQNAKIASDLEHSYEVVPIEHKCAWTDFDTTRDLLYSGNLLLPKLTAPFDDILKTTLDNYPETFRGRPMDHLAWQFATVREHTNTTVLKGDGGTDDLFRTIVLGVAQMQDEEILETLLEYEGRNQLGPKGFTSFVAKKSGGSAGSRAGAGSNSVVKKFSR